MYEWRERKKNKNGEGVPSLSLPEKKRVSYYSCIPDLGKRIWGKEE